MAERGTMKPPKKWGCRIDSRYGICTVSLHERLKRGAAILSVIDERRRETGEPGLGQNIERMVVDRELNELSVSLLGTSEPAAVLSRGAGHSVINQGPDPKQQLRSLPETILPFPELQRLLRGCAHPLDRIVGDMRKWLGGPDGLPAICRRTLTVTHRLLRSGQACEMAVKIMHSHDSKTGWCR